MNTSTIKRKEYVTPSGSYYNLFFDMLKQTHLLIAGTTGSGKSVVINGIITTALFYGPDKYQFVFVDPKRVELAEYRNIPHCLYYASEKKEIENALYYVSDIIEQRYIRMQRENIRKYDGSAVYLVIDELADLMTTNKKTVLPLIQHIAQIGRAANVHIIAGTQSPIREIIPTAIKVNFDSRVALRTRCKQDSRNILGFAGCEQLPRYGQGYYMKPEETNLYNIPMYDDGIRSNIINHWKRQN